MIEVRQSVTGVIAGKHSTFSFLWSKPITGQRPDTVQR
jgi:hypothetical protein